jgi:hypothetical protein
MPTEPDQVADAPCTDCPAGAPCFSTEYWLLSTDGHVSRQKLDAYGTMQSCVFREVDFTHSAGAEQRLDLITSYACVSGKGHIKLSGSFWMVTVGL